jgi:hypothetical protein
MVVSPPLTLSLSHVPSLSDIYPQDGSRTFIVLILATITSFFGKKHWDSKYTAGANDKKKDKGKKGRRDDRGGYYKSSSSGSRRDKYDPDEIDRCVSVF